MSLLAKTFESFSTMRGLLATLALITLVLGGCNAADEDDAVTDSEESAEEPETDEGELAETPEDEATDHGFEDGDAVTIVLGSAPGGGFDIQARLLAPVLEASLRDVTGTDLTVRVENVTGAVHRVATEQVNRAEPDGTSFILSSAQLLATNQILEGADYDLLEMTALGSAGRSQRSVAIAADLALPEATMEGLISRSQETPILLSHPGLDADLLLLQALLREEGLEFAVDPVPMNGTSEMMASLLRGETEAGFTTTAGMLPFVEDNPDDIALLVNLGCKRETGAPDLETIVEQNLPGAEQICQSTGGDDRVFVGPPDMPTGTVEALDQALGIALNDEGYLEEVRAAGLVDQWSDAATVRELLDSLVATYRQYEDDLT